jgi:hypothetical protein
VARRVYVSLSEKIDAAILVVIILWALLDRFNVYFRTKP